MGVDEIFREMRRLIGIETWLPMVAVLVLSGLGFLMDAFVVTETSFNLVVTGATLALQYAVTRRLLAAIGYQLSGPRGGAFVLLGIVAGFGILLGTILLVVPGLILFARWSVATPVLLTSDRGAIGSLQESWSQTNGHFWPIMLTFLVTYLPGVLIFVAGLAAVDAGTFPYAAAAIANVALNLSLAGGWIASVAIFALLNRSGTVAEVFE